ncbi:MAG: hypothetical protein JW990_08395 [Thermoleophilia bacterium]|nr:hypothetical protein [Thermoleophilia bacterium]
MSDSGKQSATRDDDTTRWEYQVIRVSLGPVAFQKYGPDDLGFQATLNEQGEAGWEAFHVQAFADNEAMLLFLKRRVPAASAG